MKHAHMSKYTILVLALLLWMACTYILLMIIAVSDFSLDLDFSPRGQLMRQLGLTSESQKPSLVQPMMFMLLGASGATLTLIVLQFITASRFNHEKVTPQWTTTVRRMQVSLGATAAVLLAAIGICLEIEDYFSTLPFILSGLLFLRLIWYVLCHWKAQH